MSFQHIFRNPPAPYRVMPFWFWNSEMEAEEIVYQIREMAEKGVGGFFICARQGLTVPYLSDQWFQLVAIAIEAAQRYGLQVWLYDEYPYPSGMSGGEVILQHPDAKQRQLLHHTLTVNGSQLLSYELPWAKVLSAQAVFIDEVTEEPHWSQALDLASSIGSTPTESIFQSTGLTKYTNKRFFTASLRKQLVWDVPPGRWFVIIFLEKEIEDFKYFGTYVDPCHKEAIQTFLATTYEQYAQRFQARFGETIKGFFTDEVGLLGHIPWSPHLPAFFRAKYGYELVENLPALLQPQGEKTTQVRYHFFQSLHQLLGEVYHQQIGMWCAQHNLQYLTEVPSMRITTQLYSHIPGGDSAHEKVGRSLEWILDSNAYSLRANPKIASSLAEQLGSKRAMIECFHSVGWSMTLQDAKWMLDRLAGLGINFFVFHAFFYSISGLRKHDAPPSQFLQNPYWRYFGQLADYAARLCYAMSQGRADTSIAIVHPTTSFWGLMGNPFHNFTYCGADEAEARALARLKHDWAYLCNQLLLSQIDYDHLDSELLARSSIEGKQIIIGQARYKVLILPPMTNLEAAAWLQVKAFLQAGGKVISVGLLPYERIEQGLDIAAETLEWFGLTTSPHQSYWQENLAQESGIETRQTEESHWFQGMQGAYFVPTPGGVQHPQTIERMLALLQECISPVVILEPVIGDRRSFLMRQRSLLDGAQLLFITHQEETPKVLRLHLAQHPAGSVVEDLDLTSGQVTTIPTEKTVYGWTIALSFAAYESHLLRYTVQEETQETGSVPVLVEPQPGWALALDVRGQWKLTAQQDNILRFGTFRLIIDRDNVGSSSHWSQGQTGQIWPIVETKPVVNQCADIAAMQMLPMQFRQTFGTALHGSLAYPLHCWYQNTFLVEEIPTTCRLMLDEDALAGKYILYLNGHPITMQDFAPIERTSYRQQGCDVQRFLKQGINHLVIQLEAQHDEDGVRDPLYLSGAFGVSFATAGKIPAIGTMPENGRLKSGIQEGYPYFAGTLCFTRDITIETLPREKEFTLELQGWDQHIDDCVEVLVNEHSLGVCCWSPYHWKGECVLLREGINKIEIRVTNTLNGMLEGTYFDPSTHQIVPIEKA